MFLFCLCFVSRSRGRRLIAIRIKVWDSIVFILSQDPVVLVCWAAVRWAGRALLFFLAGPAVVGSLVAGVGLCCIWSASPQSAVVKPCT